MAQRDLIDERRLNILSYLEKNEKADIQTLAAEFGSTEATIRRDLVHLNGKGLLIKTHGGAIRKETAPQAVWQVTTLKHRLSEHVEEKNRIAKFAASLINDGESLMLDGGSTNLFFATQLKDKENLLVVTDDPTIGQTLVSRTGNKVFLTGGEMLDGSYSVNGSYTENFIRQFSVDKTILSVTSIIPSKGCFCAIPAEAQVKRAMTEQARESILLADSSKFNMRAFCKAFDVRVFSTIVTDTGIEDETLKALQDMGIKVFVV